MGNSSICLQAVITSSASPVLTHEEADYYMRRGRIETRARVGRVAADFPAAAAWTSGTILIVAAEVGLPHLRILISVGGWTWSNNFSDAARTAESRRRFTGSAIEFVRRHDIDGVDIDWEYPGLRTR